MQKIIINKQFENVKLKDFLFFQFDKSLSVSKIYKLIKSGDIKVNGKKSESFYLLKEKDEVKIFFNLFNFKKNFDFLKAKNELKVFYEDENIIIVIKPRGVICQPDKDEKFDTLNNRIKKYLYDKGSNSYNETNLCHRLDKYTIGLCVAIKNKELLKIINKEWNTEIIKKFYICLAYGNFSQKNQTLISYIKKDDAKGIMVIDKEKKYNKKIITKYKVIEQFKNYAKLEVNILTGKKHQIRVHLSSIHHPVLGDTKYNKIDNLNYKFPCLVSYKIEFNFESKSIYSYLNHKCFVWDGYNFK